MERILKKKKESESESQSVGSNSLRPRGLYGPWNSLGQNSGMGSLSPGDLPNPGIEPRSPELQMDSLPAEPQSKFPPQKKPCVCVYIYTYIYIAESLCCTVEDNTTL